MNLALFDFDGTISTEEVFRPFLATAIRPHRIFLGKILLAPLICGYKIRLISDSFLRASIIKLGFTGIPQSEYAATGQKFAQEKLPRVIREEASARINWHKSQGDKVVVVSGSLDTYLIHWCNNHGIDLICSSLEHKKGTLTGHYFGNQCFGVEKARRVRERFNLNDYPIIYAYGDSKDDIDLLSLAHKRYYQWQEI